MEEAFKDTPPKEVVIDLENTHLIHGDTYQVLQEGLGFLQKSGIIITVVCTHKLERNERLKKIIIPYPRFDSCEKGLEDITHRIKQQAAEALRKERSKTIKVTALFAGIFLVIVGLLFFEYTQKQAEAIHIAMVGPLSGKSSANGISMWQAIQLYLDKINSQGGVNGRDVVLDVFDDQNDGDLAREKALEIAEENQVVAVIGHNFSTASISGGEIYKKYGIPAVTPTASNVDVTRNNDWFFRTIFNDEVDGRFLANISRQIFEAENVSIIHENLSYGSVLADIFERKFRELGGTVRFKREFDVKDPNLDRTIKRMVKELLATENHGLIFVATHALEAVGIVKALKDSPDLDSPILMPTAVISRDFTHGFDTFPKEKTYPGFYTTDIIVSSPLIFDTANEKAHLFRNEYIETYGEEADWRAAYTYDAAIVLIEAIQRTGVLGETNTLKNDRKKIRDYLAGLTRADGIEGITGINYFDEQGDVQKPISIGVFKNKHVVSAYTQLQSTRNLSETANVKSAIEEGRIVVVDDQPLYKTDIVYSGVEIDRIDEINIDNLTYDMEFHIWFRYKDDIDAFDIKFSNAIDSLKLENPIVDETKDGITYQLFQVKGKFKMDTLPGRHRLNEHILALSFNHTDLTRNTLVYVSDVVGMGLVNGKTIKGKLKEMRILSSVSGWNIQEAWFHQDTIAKAVLGNPGLLGVGGGNVDFSQFNFCIRIQKDEFSLRGLFPYHVAYYLLIASILLSVLYMVFSRTNVLNTIFPIEDLEESETPPWFSKVLSISRKFTSKVWLFYVLMLMVLITSAEIILMEWLAEITSVYNTNLLVTIFDIFWWILPAYLFISMMEHFLWRPLERKAEHEIPKLVRNFAAFIIYLVAIFGIIAYVFDQNLTKILATSGVLVMIIGLSIQGNIANIFSGIVISLERPFRIGDWVQIGDNKEGRVLDMTWRTTRLQSRDGSVICIPNQQGSETQIENFSYPDSGYWKYFTLHIDPNQEPKRVKKILMDALLSADVVLKDPPPAVRFLGLTPGMTDTSESWAANYLLSVYVDDYGKKFAHNEVVWEQVWTYLNHAGIQHIMDRNEIFMYQGDTKTVKDEKEPIELLNEIDIFNAFPEKAKSEISGKMKRHYAPVGKTITEQGDSGDSLFIIVEGIVGVHVELDNGEFIEVSRLGIGNYFGEMALLTGESRTGSVIAKTDTYLYEITKADITPFIEKQPEIVEQLSEVMARRKLSTAAKKKKYLDFQTHETELSNNILDRISDFFGI
ncbi:MAG: ABC transporter substrate-binding protein [Proteobacteria bacterium]|nr:ABC transporter substrate-binding protein [Pseudomonadota bacterium]